MYPHEGPVPGCRLARRAVLRPDLLEGIGRETLLANVRGSADRIDRRRQLGYLLERGQDEHRVRRRLREAAGCLEPVHIRHPHVHEDHVRAQLRGELECLPAGCGLADLEEARRRCDQLARGPAEDLLVIDGQNRDGSCFHDGPRDTLRVAGYWRKETPHPTEVVRARALADTGGMPHGAGSHGAAKPEPKIGVVLADDSYLVREAVTHVLDGSDAIEVLATCGDTESLMKAIEDTQPDVVVTDIRMPPNGSDDGLQVAATLRQTHPHVGVVVLSHFAQPEYGLA